MTNCSPTPGTAPIEPAHRPTYKKPFEIVTLTPR